jgi:hypothetical protein
MDKKEFFKKNDKKFLALGFKKEEQDPCFYYSKSLISDEEIEDNGLEDNEIPQLLFGNTQINKGFCLYSGTHFIWIGSQTPEEAIEFANKVVAFEEC